MDNLLTKLLQLSGIGLAVSGIFSNNWVKVLLGLFILAISPIAGNYLFRLADPKIIESEKYHAEKRARKAAEKFRQDNREQLGFEYFKATFLFAGHIAHADGEVCDNEIRLFDDFCSRLQLDNAQIDAAKDYFNQGRSPLFKRQAALKVFANACGEVEVLCENFLQTQFSFAEASGRVTLAELCILEHISQRLNAGEVYRHLLQEYRNEAEQYAEILTKQRIDQQKRQRDRQREAEAKARIEAEAKERQTDKLAKLSPAQREAYLAFAVLGIKPTKDKAIIKRAYREQIKRHHPDYLLAQGYPEALLQEATERSVKINRAYRLLKTRYRFS